MPRPVVIVTRASAGPSVEAQEVECRRWANQHGRAVAAVHHLSGRRASDTAANLTGQFANLDVDFLFHHVDRIAWDSDALSEAQAWLTDRVLVATGPEFPLASYLREPEPEGPEPYTNVTSTDVRLPQVDLAAEVEVAAHNLYSSLIADSAAGRLLLLAVSPPELLWVDRASGGHPLADIRAVPAAAVAVRVVIRATLRLRPAD